VGLWRIFGRRVIDYTLYFFCSLPILSGPALRLCWQFISVYTIRISSSILLHHISSMPLIVTSKKNPVSSTTGLPANYRPVSHSTRPHSTRPSRGTGYGVRDGWIRCAQAG
jgi:hypothetical protein